MSKHQSRKKSVSNAAAKVVINKDGSLNVHRPHNPEALFSDLYHYLLSISWRKFFALVIAFYLAGDLLFATIYYCSGPGALVGLRPNGTDRFVDCFFFSVQTLDAPYQPVSVWMNIVVTVQTYLGLLSLAIVTGLLYARFARPRARVIFSENAIVTRHNGRPCLVFRVANERLNQIVEARMTLTLTRDEVSLEGETARKFYDLKLERDYSPLFALSWTLRHFIDETSPLYPMDQEKLKAQQAAIFASLSGIDETFSQTITARNVYRYDEIIYHVRFKDIILWRGDKVHIDLKGIHAVEKL